LTVRLREREKKKETRARINLREYQRTQRDRQPWHHLEKADKDEVRTEFDEE